MSSRVAPPPDAPAAAELARGRGAVPAGFLELARRELARDYRAVEPLGLGSNGLVVRAWPVRGRDPVALKVDFGEQRDPHAHRRFEAECAAGQVLDHPHIVPLSTRQAAGSISYFAMPYAGDGRLDLMLRIGPPPLPRAIHILRSLASALDHAHARGVVHGGLRPSKVHLRPDGGCLLSGFMLRIGADAASGVAPSDVGDPAFMAPEQRADHSRVDGRADQYALAIIASELIYGTMPVVHGPGGIDRISLPRDAFPDGSITAAIRRALLPDPNLRFPTAMAFVEALTAPARKPSVETPTSSWWIPSRVRLVLVAVVLAGAALLIGSTAGRRALSRIVDVTTVVLPRTR